MLSVSVENNIQLEEILKLKEVNEIIINRDCFVEKDIFENILKIKKNKKRSIVRLERISRYDEINVLREETKNILKCEELDGILIQNIDEFSFIMSNINIIKNKNITIILDYTFNITNIEAKNMYSELYDKSNKYIKNKLQFVSSIELNYYALKEIQYDYIIIYGYIPTFISANCIYKTFLKCKKDILLKNGNDRKDYIIDRMNKKIFFKTYCKYCYNKVFNYLPFCIFDDKKINEFNNLRIDLTIETKNDILEIFNMYNQKKQNVDFKYTKLHFNKGML